MKNSSRMFSDVSLLLPFDTLRRMTKIKMDGCDDKRKLTELKVDGIILWPNLNAAAANSLLILRQPLSKFAKIYY